MWQPAPLGRWCNHSGLDLEEQLESRSGRASNGALYVRPVAQSRGPRNLCWTRHDVGGQPSFRGCPPFRVRPASSARPVSQALGDDTDNRDRALVFLACRFGESVPVNHGFLPSHVRVSRSMVLPMPCLAVNAALISAIGTLKGGLEAGSSMSFNF